VVGSEAAEERGRAFLTAPQSLPFLAIKGSSISPEVDNPVPASHEGEALRLGSCYSLCSFSSGDDCCV
jgi:hypothetical protein